MALLVAALDARYVPPWTADASRSTFARPLSAAEASEIVIPSVANEPETLAPPLPVDDAPVAAAGLASPDVLTDGMSSSFISRLKCLSAEPPEILVAITSFHQWSGSPDPRGTPRSRSSINRYLRPPLKAAQSGQRGAGVPENLSARPDVTVRGMHPATFMH